MKNILAVRNDRFGEFLLNIPALRALKETNPESKLTVAVDSSVKELAGVIECVDEVLIWNEVKDNLKKYKFDLCVILNPTKEAHLACFWARIPVRVGYARKLGFLLTRKIKDEKHLGLKHEVDYNLELVSLVGAKTKDRSLRLKIINDPKFTASQFVAIHPLTSDPVKQWPLENFRNLAIKVSELGLNVVIVGSGKEKEYFDNLGKNIPNLINKTTLIELASLLKSCKVLVSGDSGPMHLAAAVGTPVVALFRNDLPGKTAKRWGPWGNGHAVVENGKLKDISVKDIIGLVKLKVCV